ncbi:hypothetical protein O3M35_006979 [Rhynocoris fuscipes]|uniref:Invertebrate defensins family profile domain-containing protein n=1 Tax=Rhynocoris fuscipes TaxID=488301 RepID=A0AAW1DMM2_9HEMI
MKHTIACLTLFMLATVVNTYPSPPQRIQQFDVLEPSGQIAEQQIEIERPKRATCDLLSLEIMGFSVNNAACAAHCITMGRRGGRCKNAVCHCNN